MTKHLQIRNMPESMHRDLKARAAEAGVSMSDYLKRLIERDLKRPDWAKFRAGVAAARPTDLDSETIVRMIREERDNR